MRGPHSFDGASPQILEAIAAGMTEQHASAGEAVIREGEPAKDFFVVAQGKLDVLAKGEASTITTVNRSAEGDYFGEIGLLERLPRTATVKAETDTVLYRIEGHAFLDAVTQAPVISGVLHRRSIKRDEMEGWSNPFAHRLAGVDAGSGRKLNSPFRPNWSFSFWSSDRMSSAALMARRASSS